MLQGDIPIQCAYRDICYQPLRANLWTASQGISRTNFLEGRKSVIAFDTFGTPGTARASDGQKAADKAWPGERRELTIGGCTFELLYPGPTHGDGNVGGVFPAAQNPVHGGYRGRRRRGYNPDGLVPDALNTGDKARPQSRLGPFRSLTFLDADARELHADPGLLAESE